MLTFPHGLSCQGSVSGTKPERGAFEKPMEITDLQTGRYRRSSAIRDLSSSVPQDLWYRSGSVGTTELHGTGEVIT